MTHTFPQPFLRPFLRGWDVVGRRVRPAPCMRTPWGGGLSRSLPAEAGPAHQVGSHHLLVVDLLRIRGGVHKPPQSGDGAPCRRSRPSPRPPHSWSSRRVPTRPRQGSLPLFFLLLLSSSCGPPPGLRGAASPGPDWAGRGRAGAGNLVSVRRWWWCRRRRRCRPRLGRAGVVTRLPPPPSPSLPHGPRVTGRRVSGRAGLAAARVGDGGVLPPPPLSPLPAPGLRGAVPSWAVGVGGVYRAGAGRVWLPPFPPLLSSFLPSSAPVLRGAASPGRAVPAVNGWGRATALVRARGWWGRWGPVAQAAKTPRTSHPQGQDAKDKSSPRGQGLSWPGSDTREAGSQLGTPGTPLGLSLPSSSPFVTSPSTIKLIAPIEVIFGGVTESVWGLPTLGVRVARVHGGWA